MSELRWNPLLGTWTMVAPNRQGRPNLPKNTCPFCPGSGRVPDHYDVLAYDNDFPALTQEPHDIPSRPFGPYRAAPNYGKCEVILYSSDHNAALSKLPVAHIERLVALWRARVEALSHDKKILYTFIFENNGPEVGATLSHPHGQLYGYPFVPAKVVTELEQCEHYFQEKKECLLCAMNTAERADGHRMVYENDAFLAYLPFFTDYPYGAFIVPKRHFGSLTELEGGELRALADSLHRVTAGFDALFERPFPYMMCLHQTPQHDPKYQQAHDYYHFHIEFYPPLRSRDRIKWYSSSEMGAGAAANPLAVEETSQQLKAAIEKSA